jgi:two-component system, chemotaxis family, protein-glutamate methylesterase/glutaminase
VLTPRRDIIVIGASSGGVRILLEMAAALPAPIPASILLVQHIGTHRSILPELLIRNGRNPAMHARSGLAIEPGHIYVAPPDHHMLVVGNEIRLTREAKENHARPAIDPLFRSAAISMGSRVIGVVLSGRLDDGTAGLQAIKAGGGLAVVQEPADAEAPDMPASASANVAVDHYVTRQTLAGTLMRLVDEPISSPRVTAPPELVQEFQLSLGEGDAMEQLDAIGRTSKITCPDCNGVLWEINDSHPPRYRCHTGHAYTQRTLEHTQQTRADEALWSALRALQEREALLDTMARACRARSDADEAQRLEAEAEHVKMHAQQLQQIVAMQ